MAGMGRNIFQRVKVGSVCSFSADKFYHKVVRTLVQHSLVVFDRKQFLRSLGLAEVDLLQIEHKYNPRSIKDELMDGLYLWREQVGSAATVDRLIHVCAELGYVSAKGKNSRHMKLKESALKQHNVIYIHVFYLL